MGSPLGPTFSNWFLGSIEEKVFDDHRPFFPKLYVRYVDDVFAVFKSNADADAFLELLNSQHKQLQFTVERMKGTLPFLDVELKLNQNGIETWVYRKKTDTATILDFQSVAPMSWKVGLFGCLLHRAKSICSNKAYGDQFFEEFIFKKWLSGVVDQKSYGQVFQPS